MSEYIKRDWKEKKTSNEKDKHQSRNESTSCKTVIESYDGQQKGN